MKYLQIKIALMAFFIFFTYSLSAQNIIREQYINQYKDIAVRQMSSYGIPASIILAQACLESGDGKSRLAVKANNHFGIKCSNSWTGKKIYHDDDKRGECFRKYNNAEDSFKDHSEFLKNGKRYQSLFDLKRTDYKAWAHGLKAAGYATNPKYAQLLIDIIEKNNLQAFDTGNAIYNVKNAEKIAARERKKEMKMAKRAERERIKAEKKAARAAKKAMRNSVPTVAAAVVAGAVVAAPIAPPVADKPNTSSDAVTQATPGKAAMTSEVLTPLSNSSLYRYSMDRQIYQNNETPFIIATKGDTYSALAKEYNFFTSELLSFNDLKRDIPIEEGTIIYIQKKKKIGGIGTHVVNIGETMYSISQKLGIRLESLYDINGMKYGSEPEPGKILNLKK